MNTKPSLKDFLRKPEYAVIFVFGIFLLVYGGVNTLTLFDIGITVDPQWGMSVQATAGIAYITAGVASLIGFGLKNRQFILQSSLAMFCCFIFASLLRILTYGLEPLGWLVFLSIAIAVGVCRYHCETKELE